MKNLVILLALVAATPAVATVAVAQTPDAPAPVVTPAIEAPAPDKWEFTPDFLRDQNRIVWHFGAHLFSAITTDAGVNKSESIYFTGESGPVIAVSKTYFGKRGELQKQELLNGSMNPLAGTPDSIVGSTLSLQNVIDIGMLNRRVLTINSPTDKRTLTVNYDARGRRANDIFADENSKPLRTINYIYDARGLSKIIDGTSISTIERDAKGKVRSLSAIENGLLVRSSTPIKDEKRRDTRHAHRRLSKRHFAGSQRNHARRWRQNQSHQPKFERQNNL